MKHSPVIIGNHALDKLSAFLQEKQYSQILVIVDENTHSHCYPHLKETLPPHYLCEISAGEIHKNIDTCQQLWAIMTERKLDRKGIVLNLGGGVIGDMGGFVASTYKRGIHFIQIPTTLLAQVDASVGGKLGIDFHGYKNHIGLFKEPQGVYIFPPFLDTLPKPELLSGFAEVFKHHLIADREAWKELVHITNLDQLDFGALIRHSVDIKAGIVAQDPFEQGPRKALNFGHTLGHAVETHFLQSTTLPTLLHGEAVAIGMVGESYISWKRGLLSLEEREEIIRFYQRLYSPVLIEAPEWPAIYEHALQDKKNQTGKILCTLLDKIGGFKVNQHITREEFMEALNFYHQTCVNV